MSYVSSSSDQTPDKSHFNDGGFNLSSSLYRPIMSGKHGAVQETGWGAPVFSLLSHSPFHACWGPNPCINATQVQGESSRLSQLSLENPHRHTEACVSDVHNKKQSQWHKVSNERLLKVLLCLSPAAFCLLTPLPQPCASSGGPQGSPPMTVVRTS